MENFCRCTTRLLSTAPGRWQGYFGIKSGLSMHGWPPIALRTLHAIDMCSISSNNTEPMVSDMLPLTPADPEWSNNVKLARRYGGIVECSSSIACCSLAFKSSNVLAGLGFSKIIYIVFSVELLQNVFYPIILLFR